MGTANLRLRQGCFAKRNLELGIKLCQGTNSVNVLSTSQYSLQIALVVFLNAHKTVQVDIRKQALFCFWLTLLGAAG